jgi:glyoxylase-like metal-dependent hydrolase (beta-lactamase superfamily II)
MITMSLPICVTCGVQYGEPRTGCPICEDERQYVGWSGQRWTTLGELRDRLEADIREEEPRLLGIGSEPSFAIGQRALLVQTAAGNVLWDCIALLDDEIAGRVGELGGIEAIAVSHPHYYSSMVEWSRAFGDAPIYLHADDGDWVMRPDVRIVFWHGDERDLAPGARLLRLGGHFRGGTVLHWADGGDGRGALLSGDILQVVQDRRFVSFMYSYPNLIPLPAEVVSRIAAAVEPLAFDRIYGAWFGRVVSEDAKAAVHRSADRYVAALAGTFPGSGQSERS